MDKLKNTYSSEEVVASHTRTIEDSKAFHIKTFFLQWEWFLVLVFILINIMNIGLSKDFFVLDSIMSAIQMFSDKAILVFPMMMIIILGDIDISIASTMALSAVIMGVSYEMGIPLPVSIVISLVVGGICGFINGFILVKFKELAAMIVTLSTMITYRGIANIILEDKATGGFPSWFSFLGWGAIGKVPFILIFFILEAVLFCYVLHFTKFGRNLFAMGNNSTATKFSGVEVDKIKVIVFTVMGIFSAISGIFLASKMGSVRPSMAIGYELDVIAMVVLGGVSTSGGKGRVVGVVLSIFIIGFLRYGLGIVNVQQESIMIVIGLFLVVSVAIPNVRENFQKVIVNKSK